MASHDLNDGDGLFIIINGGIDGNFTDGGGNIFCSTSESRCMICENQVIVDGLWNPDKADLTATYGSITGKFTYSIHGVISADIEKVTDAVFFKFFKEERINVILQIFRQFIATGAKERAGGCFDQFQFTGLFDGIHVHDSICKKSLNSIDHAIYSSNLFFLHECFIYNTIQTGIDNGGRSARLSYDYIFFH